MHWNILMHNIRAFLHSKSLHKKLLNLAESMIIAHLKHFTKLGSFNSKQQDTNIDFTWSSGGRCTLICFIFIYAVFLLQSDSAVLQHFHDKCHKQI